MELDDDEIDLWLERGGKFFKAVARNPVVRAALLARGLSEDELLTGWKLYSELNGFGSEASARPATAQTAAAVALNELDAWDRTGPGGEDWPELRRVVEQAAERVASRLFPAREPLLLVQPGLIARYRLHGFLRRLLEASRDPRCAALFLLVPSRDRGGVPKINDTLVIPEVGLPQTLWIPGEWLGEHASHAA